MFGLYLCILSFFQGLILWNTVYKVSSEYVYSNTTEAILAAEFMPGPFMTRTDNSALYPPRIRSPAAAVTAPSGNVFVTGFSTMVDSKVTTDCLSSFSCGGDTDALLWEISADGSNFITLKFGSKYRDNAQAITINSSGNRIFIAGVSDSVNGSKFLESSSGGCAAGCSCSGDDWIQSQLFLAAFDIPVPTSNKSTGLNTNSNYVDYVYNCGSLESPNLNITSVVTAAVDESDGSIYILGNVAQKYQERQINEYIERDMAIWKFNSKTGNLVWGKKLGSNLRDDSAEFFVIGDGGNTSNRGGIYIVGNTRGLVGECAPKVGCGDATDFDIVVMRIGKSEGDIQWQIQVGGNGDDRARAAYLILDKNELPTLWIAGDTTTIAPNRVVVGKDVGGIWRQPIHIDVPSMTKDPWRIGGYWRSEKPVPLDIPIEIDKYNKARYLTKNKVNWIQKDETFFSCAKDWPCGLTDLLLFSLDLSKTSLGKSPIEFSIPSIIGGMRWGGAGFDYMGRGGLIIDKDISSPSSTPTMAVLIASSDFNRNRGMPRGVSIEPLEAGRGWFDPQAKWIDKPTAEQFYFAECAANFRCGGKSDVMVTRVLNINHLKSPITIQPKVWEKFKSENGDVYYVCPGNSITPYRTVWTEPAEYSGRMAQIAANELQSKNRATVQAQLVSRFGGALGEDEPILVPSRGGGNTKLTGNLWIVTPIWGNQCGSGGDPFSCIIPKRQNLHGKLRNNLHIRVGGAVVILAPPGQCAPGSVPTSTRLINLSAQQNKTLIDEHASLVPLAVPMPKCMHCPPGKFGLDGLKCSDCPAGATCSVSIKAIDGGHIRRGTIAPRALPAWGTMPGFKLLNVMAELKNLTDFASPISLSEAKAANISYTSYAALEFTSCFWNNRKQTPCNGTSICKMGHNGTELLCGHCASGFVSVYGGCLECDGLSASRFSGAALGLFFIFVLPILLIEYLSSHLGVAHMIYLSNILKKHDIGSFIAWLSHVEDRSLDLELYFVRLKRNVRVAGGWIPYIFHNIWSFFIHCFKNSYLAISYFCKTIINVIMNFRSKNASTKVTPECSNVPEATIVSFDILDSGRINLAGKRKKVEIKLTKEQKVRARKKFLDQHDANVVGVFGPKPQVAEYPKINKIQCLRVKKRAPLPSSGWAAGSECQIIAEWARKRMLKEEQEQMIRESAALKKEINFQKRQRKDTQDSDLSTVIDINTSNAAKARSKVNRKRLHAQQMVVDFNTGSPENAAALPGNQEMHTLAIKDLHLREADDWITTVVHGSIANFELAQEVRRKNFETSEKKRKAEEAEQKKINAIQNSVTEMKFNKGEVTPETNTKSRSRPISRKRLKFKKALLKRHLSQNTNIDDNRKHPKLQDNIIKKLRFNETKIATSPQAVFERMAKKRLAIQMRKANQKNKKAIGIRKNVLSKSLQFQDSHTGTKKKDKISLNRTTNCTQEEKRKVAINVNYVDPIQATRMSKLQSRSLIHQQTSQAVSTTMRVQKYSQRNRKIKLANSGIIVVDPKCKHGCGRNCRRCAKELEDRKVLEDSKKNIARKKMHTRLSLTRRLRGGGDPKKDKTKQDNEKNLISEIDELLEISSGYDTESSTDTNTTINTSESKFKSNETLHLEHLEQKDCLAQNGNSLNNDNIEHSQNLQSFKSLNDKTKKGQKSYKETMMLRLAGSLLTSPTNGNVKVFEFPIKEEIPSNIKRSNKRLSAKATVDLLHTAQLDWENSPKNKRKTTTLPELSVWLKTYGLGNIGLEAQLETLFLQLPREDQNLKAMDKLLKIPQHDIMRLALNPVQTSFMSRALSLLRRRKHKTQPSETVNPNHTIKDYPLSAEVLDWISDMDLSNTGLEPQLAILLENMPSNVKFKRQIDQIVELTSEQRNSLDMDLAQRQKFSRGFDQLRHTTIVSRTRSSLKDNVTGWDKLEHTYSDTLDNIPEEPAVPEDISDVVKNLPVLDLDAPEVPSFSHSRRPNAIAPGQSNIKRSFFPSPSHTQDTLTPSPSNRRRSFFGESSLGISRYTRKAEPDWEEVQRENEIKLLRRASLVVTPSQRKRLIEASRGAGNSSRSSEIQKMANLMTSKNSKIKKKTLQTRRQNARLKREKEVALSRKKALAKHKTLVLENIEDDEDIKKTPVNSSARCEKNTSKIQISKYSDIKETKQKLKLLEKKYVDAEILSAIEPPPSEQEHLVLRIALTITIAKEQRQAARESVAAFRIVWAHIQCLAAVVHIYQIPWPYKLWDFLTSLDSVADLPVSPLFSVIGCATGDGGSAFGALLIVCVILLVVPPVIVIGFWCICDSRLQQKRRIHERRILRASAKEKDNTGVEWPFPEPMTATVSRYINPDGPRRAKPGAYDWKAQDILMQQKRRERAELFLKLRECGFDAESGYGRDVPLAVRDRYVVELLATASHWRSLALSSSCLALIMFYIPVCRLCYETFDCIDVPMHIDNGEIDSILRFKRDFRIECYNSEHVAIITMSFVLLPVAALSAPVILLWLHHLKPPAPFFEGDEFKPGWRAFFPVADCIRQLLIGALIKGHSEFPVLITISLQSIYLVFIVKKQPYVTTILNILQSIAVLGQLLLAVVGYLLILLGISHSDLLDRTATAMIIFNIFTITLGLLFAIWRGQFARRNTGSLTDIRWNNYCNDLQEKHTIVIDHYKRAKEINKAKQLTKVQTLAQSKRLQLLMKRALGKRPVVSRGIQTEEVGDVSTILRKEKAILKKNIVIVGSSRTILMKSIVNAKQNAVRHMAEARAHAKATTNMGTAHEYAKTSVEVLAKKKQEILKEVEKVQNTHIDDWKGRHMLTWEGQEANKYGFKAEDCTLDPDAPPLNKGHKHVQQPTQEDKLVQRKLDAPISGTLSCRHHIVFGNCLKCAQELAAQNIASEGLRADGFEETKITLHKSDAPKVPRQRSLADIVNNQRP